MKLSIEAKIGLIGIATLAMLIWGINFLKGKDILSSTYTLHAFFNNTEGLETSAPVLMNGVKIGYIDEITLHPDDKPPIQVKLNIEKEFPIRDGSMALLISADLLGSKAIRIESSGEGGFLLDDDTIPSAIEPDLLSSIQAQIMPVVQRFGDLSVSMDTLIQKLDTLLISETNRGTLQHLSNISGLLEASLEPGGSLYQSFDNLESFTAMLKSQENEIASLSNHLNSISEALDSAGIDRLSKELITLAQQFNILLEQVNSGQGNAGKLFYSDSLYINLEMLISDLDRLIVDMNENPRDYVHFSLFGKSQSKNQ